MGRYEPYREYKESGVEWLGEIPMYWKALRIKRLTMVKRGASPRPIDDPKYFDEEGEYAWVRIADVTASETYLEATTQRLSELGKSLSVPLEPGNIFLSIAGSVGKPIITNIKCCIHDGFVYFPSLKEDCKFLYYIFSSGQPYLGLGKLGTQLNLNTDTVGDIVIGLPPLLEQQVIARFLDYKTVQIDALIAKKEALLAKLAEKRIALITQAVTKGIDPTAPMKDSGVEWLGEIPAHWRILPLKYAVTFQRGHDLPAENRVDGDVPLVSSSGVSARHDQAVAKGPGIVTGRYGTIGKFTYISEDYWPLNTTLYSTRTFGNNVRFLWYMMHNLSDLFILNSQKSAVPGVDRNDLHPVLTALPPLPEQHAIGSYLDEQTAIIDQQKAKIVQAIEKIKEYRTALITNAVTGKIDVRAVELPQSAEEQEQGHA